MIRIPFEDLSKEYIEKIEKEGNLLKINLRDWVILDPSEIPDDVEYDWEANEVVVPMTIAKEYPGLLFLAVVFNPSITITKRDKEVIKKEIIYGGIPIFPEKERKTFKKLFKREDFNNDEIESLIASFFIDSKWFIKEMLDIVKHLNIKKEFEEKAYYIFKDKIEFLKILNCKEEDLNAIENTLEDIQAILDEYPEFKDRIKLNEEDEKKIDSFARFLKESGEINAFKRLVRIFRLKKYLVDVI
jgi:hypothetical protein